MTGRARSLDHVGIVGPDLAALARSFTDLGFHVTPLARHQGGRTANHCVMLDGSYLELVSTIDGGTSATLARFLARYPGIHILALGIDDEDAAIARLARAGLAGLDASRTSRALNDATADAPQVAFTLVTPPDPPEGRTHLIRHLTPEVMWQEPLLAHDNHADALVEVLIASGEPAAAAARFSTLAGRPVSPDPVGGYALDLPRGRIRLLPPEALDSLLLAPVPPTLPWIAGLTLRTGDGNASLARRLTDRRIPHERSDDAILLEAAGVTLRFVPHGP